MIKVALLYRSREGQTAKIARSIQSSLASKGYTVTLLDLETGLSTFSFDDFDAFLLGCSIRYGKHHQDFCQFVEDHADQLNSRPSFFFSVNLTARKPQRSRIDNNRYLMKYLARTAWSPDRVEVFAGALLYSRYSFLDKSMIQLIMKLTGGSTDTSRDIEYTDWERVSCFAEDIAEDLRKAFKLEDKMAGAEWQPV